MNFSLIVRMCKKECICYPGGINFYVFSRKRIKKIVIKVRGNVYRVTGWQICCKCKSICKYRSYEKEKKDYTSSKGDSLTFTPEDKEDAIVSMPLADYIEVGVFGEKDEDTGNENVLYLQKLKVSGINNSFDIIVDEKPVEAGIDPFNKLIDRRTSDNRKKVSEASDSSE